LTVYKAQELRRDLPDVVKALRAGLSSEQTEALDQKKETALEDFASLGVSYDARDAKDFNNDSKYRDDIVEVIDFKQKKIIELGQLVYKADVLNKDNFFHVATRNGNAELSKTLLSLDFPLHPADNVNYQDDMGETLMVTACRMGNFEVFSKVLEARADVNVVRHDGASALQLAIVSGKDGRFEIIEALLKAKADVNVGRHEGKSALVLALISGNAADDVARRFCLTEALLKAGADYNMISNLVSALHEVGTDVNCTDTNGSSSAVLMRTFLNVRKTLITPVLSVVLNITARSLCAALELGDHDLVQALLQFDIDLNCKDADGRIPLIMASESGILAIVNTLLEKRADVNCEDANGKTPLIIATESGRLDIVKKLLEEKGVDVNCMDADGKTALALASRLGHLGILEKLLEEGVQVNFKDADDKTATDLAASDKIRVIQYIFLNCC
jgi:ankyrin repeat protein